MLVRIWRDQNTQVFLIGMEISTTTLENCMAVKVKVKSLSHISLRLHGLQPTKLVHPWDFPGKNAGVSCHFLLQRIFLTQGLNPGFPHRRQMLYRLSHQGSPISKGRGEQRGTCQHVPPRIAAASAPVPVVGNFWPTSLQKALKHSQAGLGQFLVMSLLLSLGPGVHKVLFVTRTNLCFSQSYGSSVIKSYCPSKSDSLGIPSPFAGFPSWEV